MMPDSLQPELDNDSNRRRIEALGKVVNDQNRDHFERILRERTWSGAIDITDWTLDAVTALVVVCADKKLSITIKHGSRYFMPIRFPKRRMLESFAEAIIEGRF